MYSPIKILVDMIKAATGAGEIIMSYYNSSYETWQKNDNTPVTEADIRSSDYILSYLRERYPDAGYLCEETVHEEDDASRAKRLNAEYCFIIDPIDGTRSFINHTDEFAVSIAVAKGSKVVAGVVYAPAMSRLYYACDGEGAYKVKYNGEGEVPRPFDGERLRVSNRRTGLIAIQSSKKGDDRAEKLLAFNKDRISEIKRLGSCLKGCAIAEGTADIHYRFSDYTKEWDTAGEEIICREAGAVFTDVYGQELKANREDYRNLQGIRILNSEELSLDLTVTDI